MYIYIPLTKHFAQHWTYSGEQTSRNVFPHGASILVGKKNIIQLNAQINVHLSTGTLKLKFKKTAMTTKINPPDYQKRNQY